MKEGVLLLGLALTAAVPSGEAQQKPPPQPPAQPEATRPPADNDRKLRPLSPEEIPPNLSFYAMDPLYTPGAPLGWSPTRIVERLNRGLVASALEDGRVYLVVAPAGHRSRARAPSMCTAHRPAVRRTAHSAADSAHDRFCRRHGRSRSRTHMVGDASRERTRAGRVRTRDPPCRRRIVTVSRAQIADDVRTVDRVGIGDLDGDGVYDFIVKHPVGQIDPGRRVPSTDTYKVDAYNGQSGAFMWRIDLGWNINHGIWFSPMVVRDLDGDGKAEVCLRTAPYAATREQILDPGPPFVLDGPEYLAVYDGATGKEIDKVDWIERGQVTDWADRSGNRSSRHMLGVAYLDGKTPSVLVVRGTYGLMKVDAWMLRNRKLEKVWRWTNERAPFMYHGQGQHSIKTGDIDGDGADEILNGSIAIDNDGRTLWGTGLGHGDRFYLGDIDPDRPGLEVWYTIEDPHPRNGVSLWEALTGPLIFGAHEATLDNQMASGLAADIDPAHPGMEVWGDKFFFTAKGQPIPGPVPPQDKSCGGTPIRCARF